MNITGGIYVIADAGLEKKVLLEKLTQALEGGIHVIQLYNTKNASAQLYHTINEVCALSHQYQVPVLVHNHWELLEETTLDGVHFDAIPQNLEEIEKKAGRKFIKGVTCSNNLQVIEDASHHGFDYISFCSLFPSRSAGVCELVSFETIKKARSISQLPFFAAGGIHLDTMPQLKELPLNGVAVISGIMASDNIAASVKNYQHQLDKIMHHEN